MNGKELRGVINAHTLLSILAGGSVVLGMYFWPLYLMTLLLVITMIQLSIKHTRLADRLVANRNLESYNGFCKKRCNNA